MIRKGGRLSARMGALDKTRLEAWGTALAWGPLPSQNKERHNMSSRPQFFSAQCSRNADEHGQAAADLHEFVRLEGAERRPDLVPLHGHGLVDHDLGRFAQPVFR